MVEFALILPVLLFVICFCIDAGRLVYTYNAISSVARDGARTASLGTQFESDCLTLSRVEAAGQAFPINADPNSIVGNSDPNNPGALAPTSPSLGKGYVYIFPAVATADPPDSSSSPDNCDSTSPRQWGTAQIHDISVQVQYQFVPLTPLVGQWLNGITVKAISVEQQEPCPGGNC
jgi:Flp pilus assembly protein TadG